MINKLSDACSIVLLGSFNPGIFHPAWFDKHGLLPATEILDSNVEVATNDVAIFTMSWVRIEVTGDRFVAKTSDASKFSPLRDLVIGVFRLLEFTPIKQMGLNRDLKYQLPNEESWHAIGHTLAPKAPWLNYVKSPGMKSITIEAHRDDKRNGAFNIIVAPAVTPPFSVLVTLNSHIDLDQNSTATDACTIISEDWEGYLTRAESIAFQLISNASTAK